ncbi:chemotaxis protein CheX [Clostridium sp. P21]|uniref:Chemotaxis protein CheX n=1 Tax=Clostridium muellerianum TaxID=2716538 RepID=A0A7Y0EEC4_9CLOT|nr:chemotaxis protein CheX [Clostridium muellerianum]NMM61828.1 chemotaxis protein CheX [Clostridium muellerianum]
MLTQLFGNYLLNEKLLNPDQLKHVLDLQKSIHVKLGELAVNSGFMTDDNVNEVNNMQYKINKKFGELSIEMSLLNEEQLELLLFKQESKDMLVRQAILDKNYMTLSQFEEALSNYKMSYSITDQDFNFLINENLDEIMDKFYTFNNCSYGALYKKYFSLLLKNVIRFVDSDFRPLEIKPITKYDFKYIASQNISGDFELCSCISADEQTLIKFAQKYAQEDFTVNDEYVQESIGEFLNLANGIFIVNMSENNIELELSPQELHVNDSLIDLIEGYCIPIVFSFGKVDFIISRSDSIIV